MTNKYINKIQIFAMKRGEILLKNQVLFSLVIIFILSLSACGRSEATLSSDQIAEKSELEYLENSIIDISETVNIEDDIDDANEELIKEFRSHHKYTFEELKGLVMLSN